MSCSCKQYQKSAQQAFSTLAQAYTAEGTILTFDGVQCTNTGCSISTNSSSLTINNSGLYYISATVTSTPTEAAEQVIQLYKNGVALPCAISTDTTVSGSVITQSIETVLVLNSCCASQPNITLRISGAAGTTNFVKITAFKLA